MKAIIVAAGKGNRLYPLTKDIPKPLLKINNETILEHQIQNLRSCGISEIVIVTGYHANRVEELGGPDIRYIYNPFYEITNSLASLWFAKNEMDGDFVYLHADVVFDRRILEELLKRQGDICLVIEQKRCIEEDMKVRIAKGLMAEIGKGINLSEAYGEFIGIAKFSKAGAKLLAEALEKIVRQGDLMLWFESAIQWLIDNGYQVHTLNTDGKPWVEIDFLDDLEQARNNIYPRVAT